MENPNEATVAANVRRLRAAKGLSLANLSAKLTDEGRPLSLKILSKIERGDRGIDVDDLVALAKALGVEPAQLLLPPSVAAMRDIAPMVEEWQRLEVRLSDLEEDVERARAKLLQVFMDLVDAAEQSPEIREALEALTGWSLEDVLAEVRGARAAGMDDDGER